MLFGLISKGNWSGLEQLVITFTNTNETQARSINIKDFPLNGKCSADNSDYIYRIVIDYPAFTTQNTTMTWDIKITNYNLAYTGMWAWQ